MSASTTSLAVESNNITLDPNVTDRLGRPALRMTYLDHDDDLENARFSALRPLQRFRIKRWDYYAVFTPQRFFSATVADLGYAGNVFVYTLDWASNELHEEGLVIPLGRGVQLPRSSLSGETSFANKQVSLRFQAEDGERRIAVQAAGDQSGYDVAELIGALEDR